MLRPQFALAGLCVGILGGVYWWDSVPADWKEPPEAWTTAPESAEPPPQPLVSVPDLPPVSFASAASMVSVAGLRRVRIVDANRNPVAGAMVAFDVARGVVLADGVTPFGSVLVDGPLTIDREAALRDTPRVASASDGTAELATEHTSLFVVARAGDSYGQGVVVFDGLLLDLPEIVVAPDRNLRMRIVDAVGRARANVPVRVAFQLGENSHGHVPASLDLETSDGDGRVTLWHAQSLPIWDRSRATVTVRAMVLGADTTPVDVPLAAPLPDVLDVPCPPHWLLRVHTWLAKGIPTTGDERPKLWVVGDEPKVGRFERVHELPKMRVPSGGLPQVVALGRAVAVEWQLTTDHVAGPASDGEEVTLDLLSTCPN